MWKSGINSKTLSQAVDNKKFATFQKVDQSSLISVFAVIRSNSTSGPSKGTFSAQQGKNNLKKFRRNNSETSFNRKGTDPGNQRSGLALMAPPQPAKRFTRWHKTDWLEKECIHEVFTQTSLGAVAVMLHKCDANDSFGHYFVGEMSWRLCTMHATPIYRVNGNITWKFFDRSFHFSHSSRIKRKRRISLRSRNSLSNTVAPLNTG